MRLGIDPKVDVAFRKLFGSEENALLHRDRVGASHHRPGVSFGPLAKGATAPAA